MNTTIGFLNAVIAKTGAPSDYAVAKTLGMTTQAISVWRVGKGTMSNEVGLRVAQIPEIDEMVVLAALQAERAKSDKEKRAWTALFEKLGGIAASVLIATTIFSAPAPVKASEQVTSHNNVYYVKSRRRKKKPFNPLKMMVEQLLATA